MTGLGGYEDSLWSKLGVWRSLPGMKVGGPIKGLGAVWRLLRKPSPQCEVVRQCPPEDKFWEGGAFCPR